jgi:hypothetical protein
MRLYANRQFTGLDTIPTLKFDQNGVFQDTVWFNRKIVDADQTNFDKNLRNKLMASGALDVNGRVTMSDELLIYGNINIQNTGVSSFYFGGSGSINGQLSLTNTNVAVNAESGGAIIIAGGASVGANMIIGDSLTVNGTTALNKVHFNSVTSGGGVGSGGSVVNYIQTPDNNDNAYSFSPIHVIRYTDYNNPIMSFLENGIKLNNNSSLCIGGNLLYHQSYRLSRISPKARFGSGSHC